MTWVTVSNNRRSTRSRKLFACKVASIKFTFHNSEYAMCTLTLWQMAIERARDGRRAWKNEWEKYDSDDDDDGGGDGGGDNADDHGIHHDDD